MTNTYRLKRILLDSYKLPLFELARHSNFLLSYIPVQPRAVTIDITKKCNSRCITCKQWREASQNELTTEEAIDLLVQSQQLGFLSVGFAGGEPLLRQDLVTLVRKANDLEFDRISVGTNGLALNETRARELVENGVNDFGISIEGIGEVHDYCRGIKGGFEKTMSALRAVVQLRDTEFPSLGVSVLTILMQPTLGQIPDIIQMCRQLKVMFSLALIDNSSYFFENPADADSLIIKDQAQVDDLINELHRLKKEAPGVITTTHAALEFARRYFKDPLQKELPCMLGNVNLYIDPYGGVYPGCYPLGPVGNIREKSLKEIIHSKEFKSQLRKMFLKECPGCSCNYPTNLRYHLPSLFEEIKWRIKSNNHASSG